MAKTIYTFTISEDFPNGIVNRNKFEQEIIANINIPEELSHVDYHPHKNLDRIDVVFEEELSSGSKTALDGDTSNPCGGAIVAHDPVVTNIDKAPTMIQQIDINKDSKTKNSYKSLTRIIYYGSGSIGDIISIEVVAYMADKVDSYDIKIVDKKNGSAVIAEKTGLTNTTDEIIDMGTISNLPTGKSRFEVQIKKNGNDKSAKVYLDTILIKY